MLQPDFLIVVAYHDVNEDLKCREHVVGNTLFLKEDKAKLPLNTYN